MTYNLIGINNGRNFRGLGGYKTKTGQTTKKRKLIRSGNLANLSAADLSLLDDFNLKYDIDFRSKHEVTAAPDRLPDRTHYHFTPVFSEDLTGSTKSMEEILTDNSDDADYGFNNMMEAYADIVTGTSGIQAYRKFFKYLLKNDQDNQALLFHCSAGKDRTGMGAVYFLNAVGVDLPTIRQDYLLSNLTTKDFADNFIAEAKKKGATPATLQSLKALMSVDEKYLDNALTIINQEFGGLDQYTTDVLKLDQTDLAALKEIYLE